MEPLAQWVCDYAVKKGVSYVEARLEERTSDSFVMKNGQPHVSSFDDSQGIGIRWLKDKVPGFFTTNLLDKQRIKNLIGMGIKQSESASNSIKTEFAQDEANRASYRVRQKKDLRDVGVEEKILLLEDIESNINIRGVTGRYLSLSTGVVKRLFVNSEGSRIQSETPLVNFFYFLTVERLGKTNQRYWAYGASTGWEGVLGWNLPSLLADEVKVLKQGVVGARAPTGKVDVVVGPQVTGIMVHESGGHPYEADRILGREGAQAGESFLTRSSIGRTIGSDAVSISDDPTIPKSFGFYRYDDEGVKARKKRLVVNGKINAFLHNRETANAMGARSNGSSRCSQYNREPIVRMSNTFVEPGTWSREELIEGVKRGVFINNFMEWNIDDRRMQQKYVGSEAYLIENGRLSSPVRNPVLEIKTTELYPRIDAVAKDIEFHAGSCGKGEPMQAIPVWFGGPSLRIKDVRLK